MNDAQRIISAGDRYSLVAAAVTKRILADDKLRPAERLDFLEKLNSVTNVYITPEMLAAIDAASDIELQIFDAAAQLDGDEKRCSASFSVLTKDSVFSLFVRANAGLAAAIVAGAGASRIAKESHDRSFATQPAAAAEPA